MGYYTNLREYLDVLREKKKLITVTRPISKDTELTPLARLQFRGLPEEKRSGFLFENVTNANGEQMKFRVATGIYASSMEIYALGMKCAANNESIQERWVKAQRDPIKTKQIREGSVQETVLTRDEMIQRKTGLDILPAPVEVPGYSGQIRTTTHIITKDPKSGWINMGNYSAHFMGKTKAAWEIGPGNHGMVHLKSARELGQDLECAIVVGGPPVLFYVAAAKLPFGVNELEVAGGLAEEPIETVKCRTVDLEVPANAEIVIEGIVSAKNSEPSNAFGEYTGYMATDVSLRPVIDINCITMRKDAIFVHVMSQMAPSESSKVRQVSTENIYLKFLRFDCKLPGILDVVWYEISQAQLCVIRMKKMSGPHPIQALHLAAAYAENIGKYFIAVDEDIDARDLDSVIWALAWRVQPYRDVEIVRGRFPGLDVSVGSPETDPRQREGNAGSSSAMLIDATCKWPYPPVSLPKKEYMDNALKIWQDLHLPELNLKQPWYGYPLGYWTKEYDADAQNIVNGNFEAVGSRLEEMAKRLKRSSD